MKRSACSICAVNFDLCFVRGARRQGKGIQIWPDGRKYVGDFDKDAMQGRGRAVFPDGTIYEVGGGVRA